MDLFEDHTAGELLFYGYPLPMFDFDFSDLFPGLSFTDGWSGSIYEILKAMNASNIPEWLAENKVGLFYGVSYFLSMTLLFTYVHTMLILTPNYYSVIQV